MKILFSEATDDYANYQFSYVIWGVPENTDRINNVFNAGFLPTSGPPEHYYLARSVRVDLSRFSLSSENRRILRKFENLRLDILEKNDNLFDKTVQSMCLRSADQRFGPNVMSEVRLKRIVEGRQTSHILLYFIDDELVGLVTALIEAPHFVHYNFAFHETDAHFKSLGIFMMTSAISKFSQLGFDHIYLGTCYSARSLYKAQFKGFEFFNGLRWSNDMQELNFLINRSRQQHKIPHLLECHDYLDQFLPKLDDSALAAVASLSLL
ncbi:hypothetical protein [Paraburkholderia solisilvae]|uniref:Aspartate/glutamate leucyltransferase n=1 Tax=Paraburkholderia solisilvae TaxID=624376 RepID=A0A6J5EH55_9BURK|nr:hypothetical protein [Paraburkholderia solisilvae]CAB3764375.1 Aspartate/glutamate leucyltransferase [Paraburkholderia solisilvae]